MQNIKIGCIPVRQVMKIDTRRIKIKKFIKNNKIGLIIGGILMMLFSVYSVLIINFIQLVNALGIFSKKPASDA